MLGIGLGVMAVLCAIGLIAGGWLFMHHGMQDEKKQEPQRMEQQVHSHAEPIPKNIAEDQKKDDMGPLEQKIKDPDPEKQAGEVGD